MGNMSNLEDGLLDQLKDIYNAEHQLLKALPKLEKKATNPKLKKAFSSHLTETEGQVKRLEEIGEILDQRLTGKTCKAMQGLIKEGAEVLEEDSENDALIDALLIGAAQRVEHYEMAAYCTAIAMAQELDQSQIVKLLQKTLDQEMAADEKLSSISEGGVLQAANSGSEMGEETSSKQKRGGLSAGFFTLLAGCLLASQMSNQAYAETLSDQTKNENRASHYAPDNSGRNMRDRNDSRVTADDQDLSGDDIRVLAKVRQEIVANDRISVNGHNVKVIMQEGSLFLRGPVETVKERNLIEETASRVASGYKVINELEVAPG